MENRIIQVLLASGKEFVVRKQDEAIQDKDGALSANKIDYAVQRFGGAAVLGVKVEVSNGTSTFTPMTGVYEITELADLPDEARQLVEASIEEDGLALPEPEEPIKIEGSNFCIVEAPEGFEEAIELNGGNIVENPQGAYIVGGPDSDVTPEWVEALIKMESITKEYPDE